MNNQNNPYPDMSDQPLLNNQNRPPPQNQHINNPYPINQPQNQGYMPPQQGYQPPPPPPNPYPPQPNPYNNPVQPAAAVILIPGRGLMCPVCRRQTDNFPKKVPGGVTWIWCFCLFIFTGLFCCIPFCVDSCLDTQIVCVVCQCVKGRQQARCC